MAYERLDYRGCEYSVFVTSRRGQWRWCAEWMTGPNSFSHQPFDTKHDAIEDAKRHADRIINPSEWNGSYEIGSGGEVPSP